MGRKRLNKPKKRVKLSIDEDLLRELEEVGVNKSQLFSIAIRKYLQQYNDLNKK